MADYAKINKDFFKKYFALKDDQTPSHDTFNRLYNFFEPEKFNSWFMEFAKSIAEYCSTKEDTDKVKHIAVQGLRIL